ncbi:MAG: hypothetical protein ACOZHQ_17275 [Thermodesulfobacteriota bacterium]
MKTISAACLGLGALLCLALAAGAAGPEEALEREIGRALTQGRELEACQLALKMQAFKGAPGYDRAKAQLLARGISLEAPLESYTIRRMIDLQNKLEAERAQRGLPPEVGPREDSPDAWDTPLRVEMITRRTFAYMIRSAGPDRRFMTDDDLAIGMRDKATPQTQDRGLAPGLTGHGAAAEDEAAPLPGGPPGAGSGQYRADPAREAGRRGLYGVGASPAGRPGSPDNLPGAGGGAGSAGGGPAAKPAPGEREVTLDELLRK